MTSDAPRNVARPRGNRVNFFQLVALLLAFALVAGVGGVLAAGLFIPAAAGAKALTDTTTQVFDDLPTELEPGPLPQASTFYYSDGKTVLARFYDENRVVVPLSKISPAMQQAMVATEDKRFYQHGGIDVEGTTRALVNNLMGKDTQGGSTLTQQYVKNVLIEQALAANDPVAVQAARESTPQRKLREAKLAISLETRMTKDQILESYLNIAQFGTKVYGVEAAARYYFSTTAAKLTPIQAATIAGVTQAPSKYDPTLHPKDAQRKRNLVLNDMYEQGYIDKTAYDKARTTPIAKTLKVTPVSNGCVAAKDAAFFCEYVTRVISNNDDNAFSAWGKTADARLSYLKRGGLKVVTTLDEHSQRVAAKDVRGAVPPGRTTETTIKSGKRVKVQMASALSSVEPGTGKITAMAQSQPYDPSPKAKRGATAINLNVDQAHGGGQGFSAGSSFKPYVLAEWLASGRSLYQQVNTSQGVFPMSEFHSSCGGVYPGGDPWSVGNSEASETGMRTIENVTNLSVNTGYAQMATQLDLCSIGSMADAIGYHGALPDQPKAQITGPSMILGTQDTAPLYQAAAYATFASGGTRCDPIAIVSITNAKGSKLQVPSAHCDSSALDPKIAATVTYALRNVLVDGSAQGNQLADGRPASGKTGTANRSQATWFVGYTPQLSTAVWTGNPTQPTDLHQITVAGTDVPGAQSAQNWLYGATVSAPVWKRYMDKVLADEPKTAFPAPDWSAARPPKPVTPPPSSGDDNKGDSSGDDSSKGKGDGPGGAGGGKGGGDSSGGGNDAGGGKGPGSGGTPNPPGDNGPGGGHKGGDH